MRQRTRRDVLRATSAVGLSAAVAGCVGGESSDEVDALDAPEGTEVVEVGPDDSYNYTPDSLTVSSGTPVRFVWLSGGHNVAVTSQPADADWSGHSALESQGFSHEHTFDVPGRYEYVCTPHEQFDMRGEIVVEE